MNITCNRCGKEVGVGRIEDLCQCPERKANGDWKEEQPQLLDDSPVPANQGTFRESVEEAIDKSTWERTVYLPLSAMADTEYCVDHKKLTDAMIALTTRKLKALVEEQKKEEGICSIAEKALDDLVKKFERIK